MGKFNRTLVFSAPLIIYALGLWGSRQALIGTIVYMVWIFMGLDEAEYRAKKPVGRDWLKYDFFIFVPLGCYCVLHPAPRCQSCSYFF